MSALDGSKESMNVVLVGHTRSGKSTLLGHFLVACGGGVEASELAQYEKQCVDSGKPAYHKYAWVADTNPAARERGLTIDLSLHKYEGARYLFTLIDTPGQRGFIKNMLTGANQADAALLVVPAPVSEYAEAFSKYGQLREHAILAFALGIPALVVAVTKMDAVAYSQDRFDAIRQELTAFLRNVGFDRPVTFVPVSGSDGANLTAPPATHMPWYSGATLVDALDALPPATRYPDLPLRMPLQDVYKISGVGVVPVGRVETGRIAVGTKLVISPAQLTTEVKSIEMHHQEVEAARSGDNIGLSVKGLSFKALHRGQVVGELGPDQPLPAGSFEAHLLVLDIADHAVRILPGYTPIVDVHTAHVACRINRILATVDKVTGDVIERSPAMLKSGEAGIVEMVPTQPLCVEPCSVFPPLARFAVRDMKTTVAVGVIRSVKKKLESGDWLQCGGEQHGQLCKPDVILDSKNKPIPQSQLAAAAAAAAATDPTV